MARAQPKRVFISSTADDLVEHRARVRDAILRLGCLPVGTESEGSGTSPTVEQCKEWVRDSELVVAIVAHRHGWVPTKAEGGDGATSITRLEIEDTP